MPAYFKIVETPNPEKDGKQLPYHVRFSANGTVKTEELIEYISTASTYSAADIDGLLSAIKRLLPKKLVAGYNVELAGIGTFSLALQCPPETDKSKIGTHNVRVRNIKFRPAKELLNHLSTVHFYRRKEKSNPQYTWEQRKMFLLDHLAGSPYITGKFYRENNHISKTTAAKDLKQFEQEGIIVREGNGPTTFYRLKG